MLRNLARFSILGVALSTVIYATPANAQATRTWVSGVGDDANPCSRTAPCKTFAGSISKTAAFGEINCIDPGGFGAVTITKSITIDCVNVEAGVLVSGTNAIIINAAASDLVTLRGLDIEGLGTGIDGIRVLSAASVHIDKVTIRGFRAAGGNGINFAPSVASKLVVTDTRVTNSGNGGTSAGIQIRPTGTGTATVTIDRVRAEANNFGIFLDGAGGTGAVKATIRDSVVASNGLNGINLSSSGTSVSAIIDNVAAVNNNFGIVSGGSGCAGFVTNSTIAGNTTQGVLFSAPATLTSYGTNSFGTNGTNGTFSSTIPRL